MNRFDEDNSRIDEIIRKFKAWEDPETYDPEAVPSENVRQMITDIIRLLGDVKDLAVKAEHTYRAETLAEPSSTLSDMKGLKDAVDCYRKWGLI